MASKVILVCMSLLILTACNLDNDDTNLPSFIDYQQPRINDTFEFITGNDTTPQPTEQQPSPPPVIDDNITIGAWNIQTFGTSKLNNDIVMAEIVDVIQDYDLIVIQEIRDKSGAVIEYLDGITGFDMVYSERLGRTKSKEQYAILYRPGIVSIGNVGVYPDEDDFFEREPYIAYTNIGGYTFNLVVIHVKPSDATREIQRLEEVVEYVIRESGDPDVIIMGDLNADCSYASGQNLLPDYKWMIPDNADTTLARSSCAYDRVIMTNPFPGISCDIDEFEDDTTDKELIRAMSDHYSVRCQIE